jgi:hypothetical protein
VNGGPTDPGQFPGDPWADQRVVDAVSDDELDRKLYRDPPTSPAKPRPRPDPTQIHIELRRHGVTLRLLHEEYLQAHPPLRSDRFVHGDWSYEQNEKPEIASLSFDERFGMLVDAEWTHRENKRLTTALREAKLKLSSACIEDIDYSPKREIDL